MTLTYLTVLFIQPKYIYQLKKTAEKRKLEQEIVYERKVQREMEKEGGDFKDKDTFLTSAYRKKLEERRKMEEELRREDAMEGMPIPTHIPAVVCTVHKLLMTSLCFSDIVLPQFFTLQLQMM